MAHARTEKFNFEKPVSVPVMSESFQCHGRFISNREVPQVPQRRDDLWCHGEALAGLETSLRPNGEPSNHNKSLAQVCRSSPTFSDGSQYDPC
jgi:hypothetical protein